MSESERIKLLVVGPDGPIEINEMPADLLAFLLVKLTERADEMVAERTELKLTLNSLYGKIQEINDEITARKKPYFVRMAEQHLIEHPIYGTHIKLEFDLENGWVKVVMPVCNDQWAKSALKFIETFIDKYHAAYMRFPPNPESHRMYIDCHSMRNK